MSRTGIYAFFIIVLTIVAVAVVTIIAAQKNNPAPPLVYQPIREYGEIETLTDNDPSSAFVFVQFPTIGHPSVDSLIADWARNLYQYSKKELNALKTEDPDAELEVNTQYDAFFIDSRYISIDERISYIASNNAFSRSEAQVFNIDLANYSFLKNSDIIDESQHSRLLSILHKKILNHHSELKKTLTELDSSWLSHIVLTHTGIKVVLPQNEFPSSRTGTEEYELTFEELGDAYLLSSRPYTTPEPAELPTPSPSSKPMGFEAPSVPPGTKIALTFDDGPSRFTDAILDILARNKARATFCVLGNRVADYDATLKKAVSQGNQVIGHSWSHRQLTKLEPAEIMYDLQSTNDVIATATGIRPKMYRPPYGLADDVVMSVSKDLNLSLINWSVDPEDWKARNPETVYNDIMKNVRAGSIVLCHDIHPTTADAMENVIPALIAKGYKLVTISELLGETIPGIIYTNK